MNGLHLIPCFDRQVLADGPLRKELRRCIDGHHTTLTQR
jgi:hypothetical protein